MGGQLQPSALVNAERITGARGIPSLADDVKSECSRGLQTALSGRELHLSIPIVSDPQPLQSAGLGAGQLNELVKRRPRN